MKVFVSTYNKYNTGSTKGEWLTLSNFADPQAFYSKCQDIHKDDQDPEFMFKDHEGVPSSLISESYIDDRVFELLNMGLEDDEQTAFIEYMSNQDFYWDDLQEAYNSFESAYRGNWDTLQDYTDEEAEERFNLAHRADEISLYFDYDKYCYTRKCEGVWISETGNVFEGS